MRIFDELYGEHTDSVTLSKVNTFLKDEFPGNYRVIGWHYGSAFQTGSRVNIEFDESEIFSFLRLMEFREKLT